MCIVWALLEMQVLFKGGPYMRKYGNLNVYLGGQQKAIPRTAMTNFRSKSFVLLEILY